MYLIPYVYRKKDSIYPIHIFNIFLKNENELLTSDENEIDLFLKDNEMFYYKKHILNNYCFIEIDTQKTNIKTFYSYIDNSNTECWRRFIMIGNEIEDFLHINNTNPDFIMPVLKNILGLL